MKSAWGEEEGGVGRGDTQTHKHTNTQCITKGVSGTNGKHLRAFMFMFITGAALALPWFSACIPQVNPWQSMVRIEYYCAWGRQTTGRLVAV